MCPRGPVWPKTALALTKVIIVVDDYYNDRNDDEGDDDDKLVFYYIRPSLNLIYIINHCVHCVQQQ